MIQIENLDFSYAETEFRLRIPELSIDQGERVAIAGPSGIGKTTLLRLLAGILVANQGRVQVAGHDLSHLNDSARRRFRISKIGFIFQDFELVEYLNVRENILLPFMINTSQRLDSAKRHAADELASSLGLADKLNRPIHQLSRGEQQRVAVCRALLPGPRILLADEPTGGLDVANGDRVIEILTQNADQTGASLICVTHDLGVLDRFDRAIQFAAFLAEATSSGAN